jgi:hypothetical protein
MKKYCLSAVVVFFTLSAFAQEMKKEVVLNNPSVNGIGATWQAMNPGETPDTAEAPACDGALVAIAGSLNILQAHLFLINITAADFGASTVGTAGKLADTILALFDADGNGVYYNDDAEGEHTLRSRLPVGHPLGPQADGCYYLAMTGDHRHPVSAGGLIWEPMPYDVVRAPDGPGAPGPLTGFLGNHNGGTYTVELTGANCGCALPKPKQ